MGSPYFELHADVDHLVSSCGAVLGTHKPQADAQRIVHLFHGLGGEASPISPEAGSIDGADLVQKDERIIGETSFGRRNRNIAMETNMTARGNRRHNHGWAETIADVTHPL